MLHIQIHKSSSRAADPEAKQQAAAARHWSQEVSQSHRCKCGRLLECLFHFYLFYFIVILNLHATSFNTIPLAVIVVAFFIGAMTVHSLYIFDRRGKTLFTKNYSAAARQAPINVDDEDEYLAEKRKLIFGMLFSLRELTGSLGPEGQLPGKCTKVSGCF